MDQTENEAIDQQIVILGAGGHALTLVDALTDLGFHKIFLTDTHPQMVGRSVFGFSVLGDDSVALKLNPSETLLLVGVGTVSVSVVRYEIFNKFKAHGFCFKTLVHPSAMVSKHAELGEGVQVMAGAIVQAGAKIGDNVLINSGAIVEHGCVIGKHSHIATGAKLSGGVIIDELCHIGTGASVIQKVHIGHRTLIGAGAVVVGDIPAGSRALGVSARVSNSSQETPALIETRYRK